MSCRRSVYSVLGLAALSSIAIAQPGDFAVRELKAQMLRDHDQYKEARLLHSQLLRDVRSQGASHRLEARVLDDLARDDQDCGDYPAAETAFNHGLAALAGSDADDSIAISLRTHLAELYVAERRPEDAEPLLREAMGPLRFSSMPDPVALAVVEEDLAVVRIIRHKLDESEALLREAQALLQGQFGPDSTRLTASLLTYSGLMTAQRRYSEAAAPAERAWQILTKSSVAVPKPYEASAQSVLATVYYHTDRLNDAADCARRAIELAEQSLGVQHPQLGFYLTNYATILKALGRKNEAKAAERRADAILDRNPSTGTGYTVNVASLR